MFSSYSEEIHIYDKYLGLLPFFDFDGVWILSYLSSAHWALSIQAQVIATPMKTFTKLVGLLIPSASASTYYVELATQTFEVLKHSEHMHL